MPGLLELQRRFAAALRGGAAADAAEWAEGDGLPPAARVRVYAHNARAFFEQALELTYPVVRRRVGDDYFRQLAVAYRARHPSRAGDLHEVGRAFPAFLDAELADTPYAWLADLARLEWACADAATAREVPAAPVAALAGIEADRLADVRFELVPSLRIVGSPFPVYAAWLANQPDAAGEAVALDAGPGHVLVRAADGGYRLRPVTAAACRFAARLAAGASLGAALEDAALPDDALAGALGILFGDGFVARVVPPP